MIRYLYLQFQFQFGTIDRSDFPAKFIIEHLFQFQFGTIDSKKTACEIREQRFVSIPVWYDW